MKRIIVPIFMSLFLLLMPVLAEAHPGRTDANGGHISAQIAQSGDWKTENTITTTVEVQILNRLPHL
ncbi:hypothetical protein M2109_002147 [Paenibacillus sp. PastH-3]|nr:hypothetical protein [Paenibacillus sp. PastH-4]MDH6443925.1 hypothetical protein [Paenibacillus sp. PastF-4]MDH6527830.1 hypothetical protein [Paenibacillus sp. PastH-3]